MSHVYAHPEAQVAHVAAPQLQRACACGESAGISGKCPECAAREQLGVQPKLSLNRPGDRYEQEADRIAERVVSARDPGTAARTSPLLQRQPEGEEEDEELQAKAEGLQRKPMEEDEEEIQAKSVGGPVAGAAVGHAAAAVAGGGRPLSGGERSWFEPRLGRDLSAVRLHDDARAGAAARGINARAYTLRNHIAFAPGAYDGRSTDSRRLLAHELVHTVQQGDGGSPAAGRVQRLLQPLPGNTPVCDPPAHVKGGARRTWAKQLGVEVHKKIQDKFTSSGRNRLAELTLPFTDTAVCSDADVYEPPTSTGRPDLAIAERKPGKVTVRLGEIKPYNMVGVGASLVLDCYENAIVRNADVCKVGAENFILHYAALVGGFCTRIGATASQMVELGRGISWQPGPVTAKGRAIATVNIGGGLIFYGCADKLEDDKKKKKKKKDTDKDKSKSAKKKAKSRVKEFKKARRQASRAARQTSRQAVKQGAKTGAAQVAKAGVGQAARRGALKKLIPGATYVEAAAVVAALLGGAKLSFAGEGMSAEEALLEMAKHGLPPDVEISPELMELLSQNPEVLELLKAAADGKVASDEAAQAMIDLLEANKDLLDEETLEKLAKFAAENGDPALEQTAEEFRKTLEAIRAGKEPTAGAGEGEAEAETEAEAEEEAEPEGEAKAKASKEGQAGKAASGATLPEDFKDELKANEPLSNLFEAVLDRTSKEGMGETDLERFRKAVAGLSEEQLKQILDQVAKLPMVEAEATEPKQKALDVVVELAAKIAAGEKLTPEQRPADQPKTPSGPTLSETEKKWAKQGIEHLKEQGGEKYHVGLKFAYSQESLAAKLVEIHAAHRSAGDTKPSSYGTLMVGIGYRGEDNVFVGTFGHVSVIGITGQRLALQIVSYKSFIDSKGNPITKPIMIPEMKKVFANINSKVYDFSKGGTK